MIMAMANSVEIVHPDGKPGSRFIAESALPTYLARGFQVVGDTPAGVPTESSSKKEWVAYATSLGIDTSSMTKQDVVDAVSAVGQAEDGD